MPYKVARLLPALLLLLGAACGAEAPAVTVTANLALTPAPAANLASTAAGGDVIVARVNGVDITRQEFERALARRQQEVNAADPAALRQDVLDQLIELQVIEQGAAAQQITVSDDEVQAEIQAYINEAGGEEAWQRWLATNMYTPEEFADSLRANLITFRVRDKLTADLAGNVRQVHARHILLPTEAEANATLTRVQNGEDFAALAAELSRDSMTGPQGGDLGWFTVEELLVPELAQAAFSLEPGAVAGPIATQLGYHVIQTLEFADRPVDEERRVQIAQARFENWLRPLMESVTVERYS